MNRWHYIGDVNLEHGGTFFDLGDWQYGYVNAIRVEDLDSAIGFRGAYYSIDEVCVNIGDASKCTRARLRQVEALSGIGAAFTDAGHITDNGRVIERDTDAFKLCLAYACLCYGSYDIDRSTTVAIGKETPDSFEGWRINTRLRGNARLDNYVRRNWLT